MAARAHAMDQVLSRPGATRCTREPADGTGGKLPFAAHGRRPHLLDRAARPRRPRSPGPSRAQAVRLVLDHATPTCSSCCGCSRRDLKEVVFQGAIDPHTPVGAGLAARLAPQARHEAVAAVPALSHPRREAAARARRGGRARHRDLADLDRGAGGLSHRRSRSAARTTNMAAQRRQAVELQERADAAAARSCTTIRATARANVFGGATTHHPSRRTCCCRSSRPRACQHRGGNAMTFNAPFPHHPARGAGRGSGRSPRSRPAPRAAPLKVGFLTVKTGPLASGGIADGTGRSACSCKERGNTLAGRPVELFTGRHRRRSRPTRAPRRRNWSSATACTCIIGPLAAFEALAIDDYIEREADADTRAWRRRRTSRSASRTPGSCA